MRIAAALVMLALCAYGGYSKTYSMKRREWLIRCFIEDMSSLAMEVEYRPRELAAIASRFTEGPLGGFWKGFLVRLAESESAEAAWREAVADFGEFRLLSAAERDAVAEAGSGLGMSGAERQLQSAGRAVAECERLLALLRSEIERKGAMYTRLGLLGGMAAALVVI